ncbi:MAG TPA: hypothetical protein VFH80_18370, partial [Solirubrobacteraceae bacterium]|nr:hypothetical protein [Solirubrobacteraceae bacterium]
MTHDAAGREGISRLFSGASFASRAARDPAAGVGQAGVPLNVSASVLRLMLPPDTMQTTLPEP